MKITHTMPDGEIITNDWPQWKTPYNHDTVFEARRTSSYNDEPSMTKQEFKEDADINVIIQRVMQTGEVPALLPEHFLDVSKAPTYLDIQERLAEINAKFYELPARIRSEHLNDPARWADEVVKAAAIADEEKLNKLGVEIERPQEAEGPDPLRMTTPGPENGPKPPEGPKTPGPEAQANVTPPK